MTLAEVTLWRELRRNGRGLRFRRQHPAGPYILDFFCAPAKLAIEVDGGSHDFKERITRDAQRDAWLARQGVRTLRVSGNDVLENLEGVLQLICESAAARLPPPPPAAVPLPRWRG